MAKVGDMIGEGKDPRLSLGGKSPLFDGRIRPQHRKLYDSSVTFEEYAYYAKKTRADQLAQSSKQTAKVSLLRTIFPPKSSETALSQKMFELNTSKDSERTTVTDEDWINASKALRNATTMAVFYLMTTDVLGPFGLPYAVATTGWG